jgi:hypothetical protein
MIDFCFATASTPALGPMQVSTPVDNKALSREVKRPEHESDCSPPFSSDVKNEWSCTSTPAIYLHGLMCSWAQGLYLYIGGPFAKFVDSPYYSESELCGGAVTVSFSKYGPWQVMHFLQRSTHFSRTCCRPLITSKFLVSELPFHGWKSPEIAWRGIWIEFFVRLGKSGSVEPH